MNKVALLALVDLVIDHKISKSQKDSETIRGPRGFRGPQGHPFNFSEHEQDIKDLLKSLVPQFDNLTEEQLARITGPAGKDGKDFSLEESLPVIESEVTKYVEKISHKLKLKFEDLEDFEKEQLKGRDGRNGRDGKGFSFEDHEESIRLIVTEAVASIEDKLKLKFSDLSEIEIDMLRGPKGRDGRDGKNFSFEEHREYFESLKPKFSDFTEQEKSELKLKFIDLTKDEVESLKLKFTDLTKEDRDELIGPRGQRGKRGPQGEIGEQGIQGIQGEKGLDGKDGAMGLRGLPGLPGPVGRTGANGLDGQDAPKVVDVQLEEMVGQIRFVFTFSDGSEIVTNWVDLPALKTNTYLVGGGGGSGSGQPPVSGNVFGEEQTINLAANTPFIVTATTMAKILSIQIYNSAGEMITIDVEKLGANNQRTLTSKKPLNSVLVQMIGVT